MKATVRIFRNIYRIVALYAAYSMQQCIQFETNWKGGQLTESEFIWASAILKTRLMTAPNLNYSTEQRVTTKLKIILLYQWIVSSLISTWNSHTVAWIQWKIRPFNSCAIFWHAKPFWARKLQLCIWFGLNHWHGKLSLWSFSASNCEIHNSVILAAFGLSHSPYYQQKWNMLRSFRNLKNFLR